MIDVTVKDDTPELMQKLDKAIGRFVRKGITFLEGQLKSSMSEPKSGRRYGDHVASAPGESPAVDTSNFFGSIISIFPSTLEGKVGTPLEYPRYLEDGTDRMQPRPLWEKTASDSLPTLEAMLAAEVQGV